MVHYLIIFYVPYYFVPTYVIFLSRSEAITPVAILNSTVCIQFHIKDRTLRASGQGSLMKRGLQTDVSCDILDIKIKFWIPIDPLTEKCQDIHKNHDFEEKKWNIS